MSEFNHQQDDTGGIARAIVCFILLILLALVAVWAAATFDIK